MRVLASVPYLDRVYQYTMWHPTRLIGGMCHYLLPSRDGASATTLDGRYAKEAMQMLMHEIRA